MRRVQDVCSTRVGAWLSVPVEVAGGAVETKSRRRLDMRLKRGDAEAEAIL